MARLRIAYVTPRYFPHVGGVEYAVRNLAEHMVSKGNEVLVLSGEPGANEIVTEELNGVRVLRIPTFAPQQAYHLPRDKRLLRDILSSRLDIVHTHSVHAAISVLPLSVKKSISPGWKLVMTPHFSTPGYGLVSRIIWKVFWRQYVARKLQGADLIHATSQFEADVISRFFPGLEGRTMVVPIGVSEDVLAHKWRGRDADYLLYSGRLERYKRVDLAIGAISHLVKNGYQLRLVIAGSGSHKAKLAKQARSELGEAAGRFITFEAARSRSAYLELLSNARAVISLSAAENYNLFLAEAHMIGVPIIASETAAAFCPKLANVRVMRPDLVAAVILKVASEVNQGYHRSNLRTAQEAADELERIYRSLVDSQSVSASAKPI